MAGGSAEKLNTLVAGLRDAGFQPGQEIPAAAWQKIELIGLGVVDDLSIRSYRRALVSLGILEQIGGGRGGVPIKAFRILDLPPDPIPT